MRSFDMLGLVLSHGIIILFSDVLRNRMVLYLCIKDRIGPGKAGNGVLEIPISIISFGGGCPWTLLEVQTFGIHARPYVAPGTCLLVNRPSPWRPPVYNMNTVFRESKLGKHTKKVL